MTMDMDMVLAMAQIILIVSEDDLNLFRKLK